MINRLAFCGYSRSGKDTAAMPLIAAGTHERRCFGDIIKRQLDPLIREHFNFSAFTENDEEKKKIRLVLESWGDANDKRIREEFFASLPRYCVNTRLFWPEEARVWRRHGGVIVEVVKPGVGASTVKELGAMKQLHEEHLIDHTLLNDGTVMQLWSKVKALVLSDRAKAEEKEAA